MACPRHEGRRKAGTSYRHFPTQEALYQAIIVERMHRLVGEADTLSATDDAGAAFFGYLTPKDGMSHLAGDMRNAPNAPARSGRICTCRS